MSADAFDDSERDDAMVSIVRPSKARDEHTSQLNDPCPLYDSIDGCESDTHWYGSPMSIEYYAKNKSAV